VNINATLFIQMLVFLTLAWVTMKFIWPPMIQAIDERREKIAAGLAAAEQGNKALEAAKLQSNTAERAAREQAQTIVADAEKRAQAVEAKAKEDAAAQAAQIVAQAQANAAQEMVRAKESLRDQVAGLVVAGAEQILGREINADNHKDLLTQYSAKL
jgi:F-type H+-transporting ATPase subunit b